jgi:hypothetical protein
MAGPQSIDQEFNDSYNRQGIQPSTGNVSSIRKVNTQYNDPTARRKERPGANVVAGTADITSTAMQATGKTAKATGGAAMTTGRALSATGIGAVVGIPLMVAGGAVRGAGSAVNNSGKILKRGSRMMRRSARKKTAVLADAKILSRARVSSVNSMLLAWVPVTWLVFQLPFAIVSLIFLGAALVVDSVGIDLITLPPLSIFIITYAVVFIYGLFVLLAIYLIYKGAMLNPLSGRGAGIKKGCLLLAFIGYSIPIANLFPWFIPWIIAVWVYPK